MSRIRTALAVAACVLSGACYRVTVVSTPAAASPTEPATVARPWAHGFIFGLVPPQPVGVSQNCPGGNVTKVVTQRSFLNGLVSAITWSLYTPMQIEVWCPGGRSSSLGLPPELLGNPVAALAPAAAPTAAAPADSAARQ
jgi:hypothetical protein